TTHAKLASHFPIRGATEADLAPDHCGRPDGLRLGPQPGPLADRPVQPPVLRGPIVVPSGRTRSDAPRAAWRAARATLRPPEAAARRPAGLVPPADGWGLVPLCRGHSARGRGRRGPSRPRAPRPVRCGRRPCGPDAAPARPDAAGDAPRPPPPAGRVQRDP